MQSVHILQPDAFEALKAVVGGTFTHAQVECLKEYINFAESSNILSDEEAAAVIQSARDTYEDDECEIDDQPALSASDEGCFVNAWVWVNYQDAGVVRPAEGV